MMDKISVFRGIDPIPAQSTSWQQVLDNIKSVKYKKFIETGRQISDPDAYREFKKNLPAVTFSGEFKHRKKGQVLSATGFIIPDLDHLGDVDAVFNLLVSDAHVWFAFRSPSGSGIKCGIRANGISNDDDIKRLYHAVEYYFSKKYSLTIDPACKDICRLTFISHDPDTFINANPLYFDVTRWTPPPEPKPDYVLPESLDNGWKSKYGHKVLESCCRAIVESQAGNQHYTRLTKSRLVGGFIPEFLNEQIAMSALESAVVSSGAKNVNEAMKTVIDGIEHGKREPIRVDQKSYNNKNYNNNKDIEYYYDIDEDVSNVSNVSNVESVSVSQHVSAGCQQDVSRMSADQAHEAPQNLSSHIREWVTNSSGYFTVDQVDREFCLTTRTEKNNRSKVLARLTELELIKKDKRIKGKYHISDPSLEFFNIMDVSEERFEMILPFDLHKFVSIPKKAVIVLAGSSNAGKTVLILNTLKLNLQQNYEKFYLMSEMGVGEYVDRLRQFRYVPFEDWQKIKAAERSHDFNGVIEHHNKHGLTCIDYLEEIQGEYYMIGSQIRDIYDSLGDGVAMVAIQKRSDQEFARGGQATAEKARLYMTVDLITSLDHSIICALKMIKVKRYIQKNLQGHEIHFKISHGAEIEPVSEWMRSSDVNRAKLKAEYERSNQDVDIDDRDYVITFRTDAGRIVGINTKGHHTILKNYGVEAAEILEKIALDSYSKDFIKDRSWFMQVTGILKKKLVKRGNYVR